MTLIKNESNSIPISLDKKNKVGLVSLGIDNGMTFHKYLNNYRTVEKIDISHLKNVRDINKNFDKIILINQINRHLTIINYLPKEISVINTLKKYNNVVLVVFSNLTHYLILT